MLMISTPKGKRELGETSWDTCLRELMEETSIDAAREFSLLDPLSLASVPTHKWTPEYHFRADEIKGIQNFVFLLRSLSLDQGPISSERDDSDVSDLDSKFALDLNFTGKK